MCQGPIIEVSSASNTLQCRVRLFPYMSKQDRNQLW